MKGGVYIGSAIAGWLIAQGFKFVLSLRRDGFQLQDLVQSGGMPSAHTAFMVALTTTIGIGEGLDSAIFALSAALTAIICYDAAGVRRATGQQTAAIYELGRKANVKVDTKITNARGHTWQQIAWGGVTGLVIGVAFGVWL